MFNRKKTKPEVETRVVIFSLSDNIYDDDGHYKTVNTTQYFEDVVKLERRTHDYVIVESDDVVTIIPSSRVAWISERPK